MHQRIPSIGVTTPQEQTLHGSTRGDTMPQQSGWKHTGVVDDKEVTRCQQGRKVTDGPVPDTRRRAIEDKQTCRFPVGRWYLGNAVRRELEIEVGNEHVMDGAMTQATSGPGHKWTDYYTTTSSPRWRNRRAPDSQQPLA